MTRPFRRTRNLATLVVLAALSFGVLQGVGTHPASAPRPGDAAADDHDPAQPTEVPAGDDSTDQPAPEPAAPQPPAPEPPSPAPDAPESEPQAGPDDAEDDESPAVLRPGDEGPRVLEIQEQLHSKGYWLGDADGTFGELTRQAVLAFQAVHGLTVDGIIGPEVLAALDDAHLPEPRTTQGDGLEIDLERQVIVVVRDGKVEWVLHTSTGNGQHYTRPDGSTGIASTPAGSYEIKRRIDGVRQAPLGNLYRPVYFNGGIAVHGAPSVPAHPASHGCARVTNAAMDFLWAEGLVPEGLPVVVHEGPTASISRR